MKTAKELQKELNGLRLESARKTMIIQNKDKEIEHLQMQLLVCRKASKIELDLNNKLWQKRFEWFWDKFTKIDPFIKDTKHIDYDKILRLFEEAQNKEFT